MKILLNSGRWTRSRWEKRLAELSNQILIGLAQTYNVTTDWILLGPKEDAETGTPAIYEVEAYTREEEEVIEEYSRADDRARETSRMVLRMNPKEQKKSVTP